MNLFMKIIRILEAKNTRSYFASIVTRQTMTMYDYDCNDNDDNNDDDDEE